MNGKEKERESKKVGEIERKILSENHVETERQTFRGKEMQTESE